MPASNCAPVTGIYSSTLGGNCAAGLVMRVKSRALGGHCAAGLMMCVYRRALSGDCAAGHAAGGTHRLCQCCEDL
jgi:hypothetical protein